MDKAIDVKSGPIDAYRQVRQGGESLRGGEYFSTKSECSTLVSNTSSMQERISSFLLAKHAMRF